MPFFFQSGAPDQAGSVIGVGSVVVMPPRRFGDGDQAGSVIGAGSVVVMPPRRSW